MIVQASATSMFLEYCAMGAAYLRGGQVRFA